MNSMNREQGFSIISAIFILVVLAALGAFMVTISTTQHQGVLLSLESSRAVAAARSGVEWGGYRALQDNACAAQQTLNLNEAALAGFRVTVSCESSSHNEQGSDIVVYEITAVAERGQEGRAEYVRRQFIAQFVDEGS